jgi:hypothetical protein
MVNRNDDEFACISLHFLVQPCGAKMRAVMETNAQRISNIAGATIAGVYAY